MSYEQGQEPSEEELRAAFEEQLKRISVEDVVVQTVVTLVNLAGRRLGLAGDPEERDLEQARLAIEATRALAPLLPEEVGEQIRPALSQLQMAYARESQGPAEGAPEPVAAPGAGAPRGGDAGGESAVEPAGERPASPAEEAERAKARSKIWTPPGT